MKHVDEFVVVLFVIGWVELAMGILTDIGVGLFLAGACMATSAARLAYLAHIDDLKVSVVNGEIRINNRKMQRLPKEEPLFCMDCGQRLVQWKHQNGFSDVTGEPYLMEFMACPDWDASNDEGYTCNRRVTTEARAYDHTHEEGEVVGDCPACLDLMVRNGIISREQFNERLA